MRELLQQPHDIPLMLEHLPDSRSYRTAADFLTSARSAALASAH
jgi:hypothetical protein